MRQHLRALVLAADKLGAQEIIDWYRANAERIRIEPTEVFQREMLLLGSGQRLSRDTGERAALELVRETHFLEGPDDRALLLSDDKTLAA